MPTKFAKSLTELLILYSFTDGPPEVPNPGRRNIAGLQISCPSCFLISQQAAY